MGQCRADEVVLMEDGTVLNLILEVHQDCILDELGLQETLLIDWTIKDALVAHRPEKAACEVLDEEVLSKVACEVSHLVSPEVHGVCLAMVLKGCLDAAMEQGEEIVELVDYTVHDLGVFLPELGVLELAIGNGLSIS